MATVHVMHSRWAREGEEIFDVRDPGGQLHLYLGPKQEQELLAPWVQKARAGGMLTVTEMQQAYRTLRQGRRPLDDLPLAARPSWRKIVPRPTAPEG